ncbi:unnamed protein product [Ophioblennius macclurei]
MPSHSAAAAAAAAFLLVLLGATLASGNPQYVSQEFKNKVDSLSTQLGLTKPAIGNNPLFKAVIRNINTSCQRRHDIQLMNATLDVYLRVFSSILGQEDSPSSLLADQGVKESILYMQDKMVDLQKKMNSISFHRDDLLGRLSRIPVDDSVVQRKALAELLEVYQAVSVVTSRSH